MWHPLIPPSTPLGSPQAEHQLAWGGPTTWAYCPGGAACSQGCLPLWGWSQSSFFPAASPRCWGENHLGFSLLGNRLQFCGGTVSFGALARCSFDLCQE